MHVIIEIWYLARATVPFSLRQDFVGVLVNGLVTGFDENIVDTVIKHLKIHAKRVVESKNQFSRKRRVVSDKGKNTSYNIVQ